MNAIEESKEFQTMKMKGMSNGKIMQILIDSGSTYNFLDVKSTSKMGYQIVNISSVKVINANSNAIDCNALC